MSRDPSFSAEDDAFMQRALDVAAAAIAAGEVPVGAVVVMDGQIVGEGFNAPISCHDPTAHAEVQALRQAAGALANYRLPGATLYVTLEPCAMCAGAIVHARVARVVYAATEPRAGAVESTQQFFTMTHLNHRVAAQGGLRAAESSKLLKDFFAARRQVNKPG
jgi:tRNA(adenine34) deaminase